MGFCKILQYIVNSSAFLPQKLIFAVALFLTLFQPLSACWIWAVSAKSGLSLSELNEYDKQKIMDEVREKKIDVLIATPIIEVGGDIPNATVTVIMSAERFGLAQLHQLRGRVGRGKFDSYCFLVPTQDSELGHERLQILVQNSDGFNLSEEDLRIRGPGDYLGTKQSGWNQLKIATIEDRVLLQMAREEAKIIVSNDVNLRSQENEKLNIELKRITQSKLTEFF